MSSARRRKEAQRPTGRRRTPRTKTIGRGPEFLRLANALSALYPKDSEEKRLFDAMLVAVSR